MKIVTVKQKVDEILQQEFRGNPSRKDEEEIRRLQEIVLMLAKEIDKLNVDFNI